MDKQASLKIRSCVSPAGKFIYSEHQPFFRVRNLREHDYIGMLGQLPDGTPVDNQINFPDNDVEAVNTDWVLEIPNPFPFRGATFIVRSWADVRAEKPETIVLPPVKPVSWFKAVKGRYPEEAESMAKACIEMMPDSLKLALASTSTDSRDILSLLDFCCEFVRDDLGNPVGMAYIKDDQGRVRPLIKDHALLEVIANNRFLPDDYKRMIVLKPGVQGGNEIVGEYAQGKTHVFEYLRRNSYIPWGHYAANMADDAVRYRIEDLTAADMQGLRHLYYQRIYIQLAQALGLKCDYSRKSLSPVQLEELRCRIIETGCLTHDRLPVRFCRTLWGWNYGFDYAASGYRLHGSHQQIHQQFALIPALTNTTDIEPNLACYACGDLIEAFIHDYRTYTGRPFFEAYIQAIETNTRMDQRAGAPCSLVIYQDEAVMLFVPKAQTSQWEIQLMTRGEVGNIIEADTKTRSALDRGILTAVKLLSAMGAKMITTIEYSKRLDSTDKDQRLLYAFLPKLPESPGSFTQAQLRWINGHYPEDFSDACRRTIQQLNLNF